MSHKYKSEVTNVVIMIVPEHLIQVGRITDNGKKLVFTQREYPLKLKYLKLLTEARRMR